MITPVVVVTAVDQLQRRRTRRPRRTAACPVPSTSGWIDSRYSSTRPRAHQRPHSVAAAEIDEVLLAARLSAATASTASPSSRDEFSHGSGSVSVVEATYLCVLLSTSVNGLSVGCSARSRRSARRSGGRTAARRPRAMPSPIVSAITWSAYGRRPAAVREAAPRVLVGSARRLHDAVEREVLDHDDLAHADLLAEAAGPPPASHQLHERLVPGSTPRRSKYRRFRRFRAAPRHRYVRRSTRLAASSARARC